MTSLFILTIALAAPQVAAEILEPILPQNAASDHRPSMALLLAWLADGFSLIAPVYLSNGVRRVLAGYFVLRAGRGGQRNNAL